MSTANITGKAPEGRIFDGHRYPVKRRRYTPEEKAAVLAVYVEVGLGPASKQTGVPSSTLSSWTMEQGITPKVRKPRREESGPRLPLAPLLARFRDPDEFRVRCYLTKGTVEQWRIYGIPAFRADRICCEVLTRIPVRNVWPEWDDYFPPLSPADEEWIEAWAAEGEPDAVVIRLPEPGQGRLFEVAS
jgi:hypothetical protein